jgi:hypothetical protein
MIARLLRAIRSSGMVRRDLTRDTTWAIIGWWEARRIPFNLIVGATGALTSVAIVIMGLAYESLARMPVFFFPDPPLFIIVLVVLYAIAANVCYTGGWIMELLIRHTWPDESPGIGTLSFTLGVVFAVIITLLPIPLFALLLALGYALGPQK